MDLISTVKAAELLDLTPRRVRQLKADLGGIGVGGTLVFHRSAVERYAAKPRPKAGWKKGRLRKRPAPAKSKGC